MQTLSHKLDVSANGASQDWIVQYAESAVAAVQRDSSDLHYIESSTLNDVSTFECADGPYPELGFISAITVHHRMRTTSLVGAPTVDIDVLGAGSALSGGATITPTLDFITAAYRIDVDVVAGARFTPAHLADLGITVTCSTAPTTGHIEIVGLWVEVEWSLSPEFYDPVHHVVTPDSILGQMDWIPSGSQAAAIVGTQLVLTDVSGIGWKNYTRGILQYGSNYITEVSTRFTLSGAGTGFCYRAALVDDATIAVDLCCFVDTAGNRRVGLITPGLDHDDSAAYFDSVELDWTDSHHYRLVIDRTVDPGDSFNCRLYLDYADSPILDVNYFKFVGSVGSPFIQFGTGDAVLNTGMIVASVDFIDWRHYRKAGSNWRYWHCTEIDNNTVQVNTTDSAIVKPITITPPGITTGQSQHCCALSVQDLTDECSIRTYCPVPSSFDTYDLTLDYRVDTFPETAKLLVQRTSDHYFWNEAASVWQAAATDVTVPYSPIRVRTTLMTSITTTAPDNLIITVRNDTGAAAAHTVLVYKVDLR